MNSQLLTAPGSYAPASLDAAGCSRARSAGARSARACSWRFDLDRGDAGGGADGEVALAAADGATAGPVVPRVDGVDVSRL